MRTRAPCGNKAPRQRRGRKALIGVSVFLFFIVFELLSIVSVQDQKITALAQLVGILMEKQKLADPEHRAVEEKAED